MPTSSSFTPAGAALRRLVALIGLSLCSCTTPGMDHKGAVLRSVAQSDYAGAENHIRQAKNREYGKRNAVLYYLDLAMVLHDAKKFRESDGLFDLAQRRMEELFTKSVSRHAGRYALSEGTVDYRGAPFEQALSYAFRALNFAYQGDTQEALVEVRKANTFLVELRSKRRFVTYNDDAFMHYLGSLLYDEIGSEDDARISRQHAAEGYRRYAAVYKTTAPRGLSARGPVGEKGEIVLLHYNCLAPVKAAKAVKLSRGQVEGAVDLETLPAEVGRAVRQMHPGDTVPIVYPEYRDVPCGIAGSIAHVGGTSAETELVQDIAEIAKGELRTNLGAIIRRALARHKTRSWAGFVFRGSQAPDQGAPNWGEMLAAQDADTRSWTTVPGQIRMARLTLPPGTHEVTVRFLDRAGGEVGVQRLAPVTVRAGRRSYVHCRTAG